ncbi:MAG: DUF4062 domain-containing protein [Ignavibacteria bacterium]|nr:DUF4062 domain-containing protein [Ignavibacteria bacterium]
MKPKIFVSSTILDFEDLRSALKFHLEELDFEVQMSEFPNFEVDKDSDTFDACMKNLKKCQYFILLIGYRRGAWYEKGKLSITHREYLAAKSLIEAGHPLRIISFVRKPIWLLRSDRTALLEHFQSKSLAISKDLTIVGSPIIDDPEYIFKFVDEIKRGVMLPKAQSPVNNWIFDFDSFEDIVTALKNSFNITESLEEKKYKRLLINELIENRDRFFISPIDLDESEVEYSKKEKNNYLDFFRRTFFPRLLDKEGQITAKIYEFDVTGKELMQIFFCTTFYPSFTKLYSIKSSILSKVLNEGLLLSYDNSVGEYKSNYLIFSLNKLLEMIESFNNFRQTTADKEFNKDMSKVMTDGSARKEIVRLTFSTALAVITYGYLARIPELISSILKVLEKKEYDELLKFDFSMSYAKNYLAGLN